MICERAAHAVRILKHGNRLRDTILGLCFYLAFFFLLKSGPVKTVTNCTGGAGPEFALKEKI